MPCIVKGDFFLTNRLTHFYERESDRKQSIQWGLVQAANKKKKDEAASSVGVISLVTRRKKAAEQKAQSLKNSMVESFNRLSSSMSAVMGAHGSSARQPGRPSVKGPGAAGQRGTGRGAVKGVARGGGKMAGNGAGRGIGKRPVKGPGQTNSPGINTPLINPKGKPNKSRSVDNSPAKVKRKKQKQKKAGKDTGAVRSNLTKRSPC